MKITFTNTNPSAIAEIGRYTIPAGGTLQVDFGTASLAPPTASDIALLQQGLTLNQLSCVTDIKIPQGLGGTGQYVAGTNYVQSATTLSTVLSGVMTATTDSAGNLTGLQGTGGVNAFPISIGQSSVPVCIPPGNGSTTGLNWTNTSGAFSLTTTVLGYTYGPTGVSPGIWMYIPVGGFGGGLPASAGLYWAVMTSASAGQLYSATYGSGNLFVPTGTLTPIVSVVGYLTQTTGDLTLCSYSIPAGYMGLNGTLKTELVGSVNNTAGTKTAKVTFGGSLIWQNQVTTVQKFSAASGVQNRGVANRQSPKVVDFTSVGGSATGSLLFTSVDTTAAQTLAVNGAIAVNTDYFVYESIAVSVTIS